MFKKGLVVLVISLMVITAGLTFASPTVKVAAANPSADLDQCANDQAPSPSSDGCDSNANQWVNGNLGASKSFYFEGDSIPYRMLFDNLPLSSHTVTIEWDTTQQGTHAIDYITSYNQSVLDANPCLGVSGCSTFSTFPIPADPQVTGAGVTPIAGNFTLYGGTITSVSAYSYANGTGFAGDKSARISITFTASVVNPVLAWGGHISDRADWGLNGSAVTISGSPYHTRLIDLDGSGGNQDRSLSADAVVFPGSITIIKDATPNGSTSFGFTASPTPLSNFSLVDDGTSANTKVFSNIVTFQTYTVNESTIPAGWGFDSVSCSVTSPNSGSYTTSTTTVNINMNEGENWTCTYLDSQRIGTLTVIKHVVNDNGGTAVASDWSLHVKSGSSEVTGSPQPGSESGTSYTLAAGTYNVSETGGPSGYTFSGFSGDCDTSGNVTVVVGQSKTCTLTNNDQQAYITVVKVVHNNHGGTAQPNDFNLTLAGNAVSSGVAVPVNPGTYTTGETLLSGYTFDGFSGDCNSSGDITVALGQNKTCTLTNSDQQSYVTVVKVVHNNHGGTAAPNDFSLKLSGSPVTSGVAVPVNPGTYTASETLLSGYTFDGFSGDCNSAGSITVALGESKTCTLTNSDQQASITVVKVVHNNHGGTAQPNDFNLTLAGNAVSSGVAVSVNPGTYTAGETLLSGYTFDGFSGDCNSSGSITVALGESKTCTLTNSDKQSYVTVVKVVHNNHGGTAAPNDFKLTLDGNVVLSGVAVPVNPGSYTAGETLLSGYSFDGFSGDCDASGLVTVALGESKTCTLSNSDLQSYVTVIKVVINDNGGTAQSNDFLLTLAGSPVSSGVAVPVNPGSYTASETLLSGYSFAGFSGDCNASGSITVGLGESKTCTLTNNDIPPQLHLRKTVVNDNGGTATVANFTLTADGTGSNDLSGTSPVDSGAGLKADTFALSESSVAGYAASGWVCVGGTQNGSSITLGIGGSATCTITNDDIAPILHLRKTVVNDNGGTATVASFTLTANGTGSNDLSGISPVDSGAGLKADTFALSETTLYGYSASAWVCQGGTQNGSNITLALAQEATCTITNDDQPGIIRVIKDAKPASGSFSFTTTGSGYANFSLTGATTGNGNVNQQTLNAGSYTVKEATQLGWILTGIGGSTDPNFPYNCTVIGSGGSSGVGDLNTQTATITLHNGDTVVCVFENTGNGVTRTQGFWATHTVLANIAWFGGSAFGHTFPGVANTTGIGDTLICGRPIDDLGKLMGGFWADISKKSDGTKRSQLDQARMQLLQQLLAAELNASAFGSVPSQGTGAFAQWESALCGTNTNAIKTALQQAASFNTQGDSALFTPGVSADSKYARQVANIPFWDVIKP